MKKIAEIKDKVKGFVTTHKTACVAVGSGIIFFGVGAAVGSAVQDHVDFGRIKDGVIKSTQMGATAGVRAHMGYIRENIPEAYKQIKEFMKDNPNKYDLRKRLMNDDIMKSLGNSVGEEIPFEAFK